MSSVKEEEFNFKLEWMGNNIILGAKYLSVSLYGYKFYIIPLVVPFTEDRMNKDIHTVQSRYTPLRRLRI